MDFLNLYHYLLEEFLFESVNRSFIAKLNAEIEVSGNLYRKKDKAKFKEELKTSKKKLIAKLVKENYNSILSNYFPFLESEKNTTDEDFYDKLFNKPEVWEKFDSARFKSFIDDVEDAIHYFASRNHSEFSNLNYLSKRYIKY